MSLTVGSPAWGKRGTMYKVCNEKRWVLYGRIWHRKHAKVNVQLTGRQSNNDPHLRHLLVLKIVLCLVLFRCPAILLNFPEYFLRYSYTFSCLLTEIVRGWKSVWVKFPVVCVHKTDKSLKLSIFFVSVLENWLFHSKAVCLLKSVHMHQLHRLPLTAAPVCFPTLLYVMTWFLFYLCCSVIFADNSFKLHPLNPALGESLSTFLHHAIE